MSSNSSVVKKLPQKSASAPKIIISKGLSSIEIRTRSLGNKRATLTHIDTSAVNLRDSADKNTPYEIIWPTMQLSITKDCGSSSWVSLLCKLKRIPQHFVISSIVELDMGIFMCSCI